MHVCNTPLLFVIDLIDISLTDANKIVTNSFLQKHFYKSEVGEVQICACDT